METDQQPPIRNTHLSNPAIHYQALNTEKSVYVCVWCVVCVRVRVCVCVCVSTRNTVRQGNVNSILAGVTENCAPSA